MKNIKNLPLIIALGLTVLMSASCTDWLSVDPEDEILEEQAFDSESAINAVLNGIYLSMSSPSIYGYNMSSGVIEVLAQYYAITSQDNRYFYLNQYDYTEDASAKLFKDIWSAAYNVILDINFFLEKLEASENVLTQSKKNILLGEAYGLRAYIHLDMLRLFGPVYSLTPESPAIPYYTKAEALPQPILTAEEVMKKIMADINKAKELLENDPVRTRGIMVGDEFKGDFYTYRNRRMNYYAVMALNARALMWSDRGGEAATLAKALLLEIGEDTDEPVFRWGTMYDINGSTSSDRAFSNEVMFGIHNYEMVQNYNSYFSSALTSADGATFSAMSNVFYWFNIQGENLNTSTDFRKENWSAFTPNPIYYTTVKLRNLGVESDAWYFQPLIRKTELYYIIAEVEQDVDYLDAVRTAHGKLTLGELGAYDLPTEIDREMMLDLFGEGQLFFHYKRLYATTIRPGNGGTTPVTMNESKYVVPLPQSEIDR